MTPTSRAPTRHDLHRLERLERLAKRLDTVFRIPGTRFRVGWDPIAGIVPVIGDLLAALPAAYIILESYRMGLPRHKLARQVANWGIDTAVGSIPLIGTIFDAGWKASKRNVKILRDHVDATLPPEAAAKDVTPPGSRRP